VTTVTSTYDEKTAAEANAAFPTASNGPAYTDLISYYASTPEVDAPGIVGERFKLAAGANNAAFGIVGASGSGSNAKYYYNSYNDSDAYNLGVLETGSYSITVARSSWTTEGLSNSTLYWYLDKNGALIYQGESSWYSTSASSFSFDVTQATSNFELYITGYPSIPYKAFLIRNGNVGAVPPSNTLNPVTTSDVAKLTSKQLASLSPEQVGFFSTSMIAALTPRNILGLTSAQIAMISSSQIAAFQSADLNAITSKQWPAFNTAQIQQLETTQINKLNSTTLGRLSTSQVAAFTTAQIAGLSPTNIVGLTSGQIRSLSTSQIKGIESTDIVKLTSKQIAVLSTLQVQALELDQINSLRSTQLKAMSGDQIGVWSSTQIPALSTAFINGLSTLTISALSPSFVDVLETRQLAALGSLQTRALTTAQLEVLSEVQVGALSASAIKGLVPSRFASLSTSQLAGLNATNIKGLSSAQIAALTSAQIAAVDPIDWKALASTQLKGLTASNIGGMSDTHLDFIGTTAIKGIALDAVKAMTTSQIVSLSTIQLCALTSAQKAIWSTTQTSALSGDQIKALAARTPLAFDLTDQGVRTLSIEAGVLFDIDADGDQDQVAWIDVSMAYLVNDLNANGNVDSGAELFGDATRLSNGSAASDGFEALASLDLNEDGWIDAEDDVFSKLALWRDANSNGISEPGELTTLNEQGIFRVSTMGNDQWTWDGDNIVGAVAEFQRGDGSDGLVADIWLQTQLVEDDLAMKVRELGKTLAVFSESVRSDLNVALADGANGVIAHEVISAESEGSFNVALDQPSPNAALLGDVLSQALSQAYRIPTQRVYPSLTEKRPADYETLMIKTLGPP